MTTQELKKAIDRSRSHTEIVSVDATGNQAELVEVLSGLYDGEIAVTVVRPSFFHTSTVEAETVDVWGYSAELVEVLSGLYDGEIDATVVDDETVDVWGYRADAPLGSAEWGLRISLRADAELGNSL